jgi:glycosyltransferase involved in cell wall biosynthesis
MCDALATDFGIDRDRIVLVDLGIDRVLTTSTSSSAREAMRRRLGVHEREHMLLFFGNVAPYKGVDVLLDAFDELAVSMPVRLAIVGRCSDASLAGAVRDRIESSPSRGAIEWLEGYFPDDDVAALFHAADLLAMPYRGDIGQSAVLFMAIASGLRVVASDVGALRDSIPPELGLVVPPDDTRALAEGIRVALTRIDPPADAAALASQHLWSATVQPLLRVYATIAGR